MWMNERNILKMFSSVLQWIETALSCLLNIGIIFSGIGRFIIVSSERKTVSSYEAPAELFTFEHSVA